MRRATWQEQFSNHQILFIQRTHKLATCQRALISLLFPLCGVTCQISQNHVLNYNKNTYNIATRIPKYRKRGKIHWAKHSRFSLFLSLPQKFSREFLAICK